MGTLIESSPPEKIIIIRSNSKANKKVKIKPYNVDLARVTHKEEVHDDYITYGCQSICS